MAIRRLAAALVVVALAAGGCGDDSSADGDDPVADDAGDDAGLILLEIADGDLEGGARRESASLGDEVTVVVRGDSTDQVHLHGYDLYIDLEDGDGELTFDALIPGVFEIELEEAGQLLVQLEIS